MNLIKTIYLFGASLFGLSLISRVTNAQTTTENILSFSGGGSFGAVEIGILSKLFNDNKLPTTNYDLYTGISAGGLNVGFLSHYDNLKYGLQEIKQIYSHLSNRDVYELRPLTGVSLLNTEPLKNTITNILSRLKPISPSMISL